jgi:plastocyanin/DNA-binding beta-propeller fold protein YncE
MLMVVLLAAACGSGGPAASPQATPLGVTAATEATATMAGQSFRPHTLVLATGATVTWHNDDDMPHALTSNEGWFESGEMAAGDSFVQQFDRPGTFRYHCSLHPDMEGVVIVLPGGAVTPQLFDGRPVQAVFQDSCSGCHGPNREGATGPALIPGRLEASDQVYFDAIMNGRPGTAMPAWGPAGLSEEEVWALVGYIFREPSAEAVHWGLEQVAASREVLIDEATLPAGPSHDGNVDNLMLVTEREARSIAVVDGDTHRLLGHIQASYRAHGYAFDPTSDRWAYNVGRDGWLFKIDLYSLQAVSKVRVGLDSRGLAISDDGKYAIVGNYIPNSAVVVDARTLQPVKVIVTEGQNPQGEMVPSRVAITSDVSPEKVGPYFILALKEAGQMWRIDYSQPDFPIDKLEGVGNILHDGFLSADNRYFYVASQQDDWMAVVDVADWKLVTTIATGDTPHPGSGAVWEANGRAYAATVHAGEGKITVWDLADNSITAEIETSGPGLFIRSHHDSPTVWADTMFADPANRIYVIDGSTFEVVKVIEEGIQPLHPEFTHNARFVYVADWLGNVVRVYDARTFEKVAEVGGVQTPTGIFNTARRSETLGH